MQAAAKNALADCMSLVLAAKMAMEIQRLDSVPDGEKKSRTWRQLAASLAVLRSGELQGARVLLEREKVELRRELKASNLGHGPVKAAQGESNLLTAANGS